MFQYGTEATTTLGGGAGALSRCTPTTRPAIRAPANATASHTAPATGWREVGGDARANGRCRVGADARANGWRRVGAAGPAASRWDGPAFFPRIGPPRLSWRRPPRQGSRRPDR